MRKLKAVPHTRGLSYDSQGEFVAALSASGLLQVWEMMNGKQVLNMKKAGPEVRSTLSEISIYAGQGRLAREEVMLTFSLEHSLHRA